MPNCCSFRLKTALLYSLSHLLGDLSHSCLNSLEASLGADLLLNEPLATLAVLKDELRSGLDLLTDRLVLASNLNSVGALSDGSVSSLVNISERLSLEGLLPLRELLFEASRVLRLEKVIILLDVDTENVLKMLLSAEILPDLLLLLLSTTLLLASVDLWLLHAATGEASVAVGDVETTIASTLHGTENSVSGGGTGETDIEVGLEWLSLGVSISDVVKLTVSLGLANMGSVHLLVLKESTGEKKTSGVGCSVVSETTGDTEAGELLRVGSTDGHVTLDGGVDNRGEDALVGEADDESVLFGVVLVLVVNNETLTSVVVRLALSSAAELSLVSLRVSLVFQNLNVSHCG